jgi:hypothetical protein
MPVTRLVTRSWTGGCGCKWGSRRCCGHGGWRTVTTLARRLTALRACVTGVTGVHRSCEAMQEACVRPHTNVCEEDRWQMQVRKSGCCLPGGVTRGRRPRPAEWSAGRRCDCCDKGAVWVRLALHSSWLIVYKGQHKAHSVQGPTAACVCAASTLPRQASRTTGAGRPTAKHNKRLEAPGPYMHAPPAIAFIGRLC